MRYISMFSGIEAASVAWECLGWKPMAFAEVDEFACAVLANRYPDVPNLGDVTKIDWSDFIAQHGRPDIVVGGSPCQAFSISGNRRSLMDSRGNLMYEYIRAVGDLRPEFWVWENTPGCLNVRDDAFGQLLQEMEDIGYTDVAWRVLDSSLTRVPVRDGDGAIAGWVGPVPQRRRRVFLVGHSGAGGGTHLQRYSLTPVACQGILRRVRAKRGKPLPPVLEAALEQVAGS